MKKQICRCERCGLFKEAFQYTKFEIKEISWVEYGGVDRNGDKIWVAKRVDCGEKRALCENCAAIVNSATYDEKHNIRASASNASTKQSSKTVNNMNEKDILIRNFRCSAHGNVKPLIKPSCPKCSISVDNLLEKFDDILFGGAKKKIELKLFIQELLEAQIQKIQFTTSDVQDVGDHYWDYDYAPTYTELLRMSELLNEKIKEKSLKV